MRIPAAAVIIAVVFSGCFQQIAISSLGGIMDTGFEVLNEEQDLDLADKSIASDLKLVETILRKDPDNPRTLLLACIGYASYALGFVEDDSAARARVFYDRARAYGMRILNRREKFARAVDRPLPEFQDGLAALTQEDVPAMFWTAAAWGSSIRLNLSDPAALAELPKVEGLMQAVLARDPAYFHGGAHFFLGTLYGSRSKLLGGDPDLSRRHFEECLGINGGRFLMTYIYYAQTYAVQTQDRALFERCLTTVDTTSIDVLPDSRLSNAVAKRKARMLRAKMDELF